MAKKKKKKIKVKKALHLRYLTHCQMTLAAFVYAILLTQSNTAV